MAEGNKILVSDGQRQWLATPEEFAAMNRNRPAYLPPVVAVDETATVDTVVTGEDGKPVRVPNMPAENVRKRAEYGEDPVATPEKIELARQVQQDRETLAIADEEDLLQFARSAVPGIQFAENALVGEEAANTAREQLATNMGATFAGNLFEFALGARLLGMGTEAAFGARAALTGAKNIPGRVAGVAAEGALADSHFYFQNVLDTSSQFSAEEWAKQATVGAFLGSPFVLGAASRGAVQAIRKSVGQSNALEILRTGAQAGAVLAPPGSLQAAKRARAGGFLSIASRLFRNTKKRPLAATEEMAEQQIKLLDDLDVVSGVGKKSRTEWLDNPNLSAAERGDWITKFKAIAADAVPWLDEVAFGTIGKRIRTMNTSVQSVRREARGLFTKLDGSGRHADWIAPQKWSQVGQQRVFTAGNRALNFTSDAGMAEVAGTIRRTVLKGGDPESVRKGLVEAAFQAKLRRSIAGGADSVDGILSEVLTDAQVWGARTAGRNAEVLAALDETVSVWDELGQVQASKTLGDLGIDDGLRLQGKQEAIARLRRSINTLADNGMLSERQVKNITGKLVDADDALLKGTGAYHDAIRVNKALSEAEAQLAKRAEVAGTIPDSPESFAAAKLNSVMDVAQDVAQFGGKALDMVLATKPLGYMNRGVGALHGLSAMEKYEVFDGVSKQLHAMVGEPEIMIDALSEQFDRGAAWDPIGADLAAQKSANILYYLQSQLPRTDDTIYGRQVPQPLSSVEEFLEKMTAVYDPVSVAYEALSGRATPAMVDAVRITQPETYAALQLEILAALEQAPANKANPQAVTGASLFLGGMDTLYTGDFISQIQSSYAQTPAQQNTINGPSRPLSKIDTPDTRQLLTPNQNLQTY